MSSKLSRRSFVKTGVAATAAAATLSSISRMAHADSGTETLKIGLVGCGGRGTGAAHNALDADPNTEIVAIADLFEEKLAPCAAGLKEAYGDRAKLDGAQFSGFDGYKAVIDKCDVVLLCTTPFYRPIHLRAAVEAGKHVFFEKPVAVDPVGIRSVLESAEIGKQKGLTMVCGLCWRYHKGVQETMKRVLGGEIGDILAMQETYLTGSLWTRPRQEGDTEMRFQNRNWYYFKWLSGDFNVEQHVHSLDKAMWAMGDVPPIDAWGVGARMVRTEQPIYGDVYDSMCVTYNWPNGVKCHAYCRQQPGCYSDTSDQFIGTKGVANILNHTISDLNGKTIWKFRGHAIDMYLSEHQFMFDSIRNGKAHNDGKMGAQSTMLGILGRESCYTGKAITWDEIMKSDLSYAPKGFSFDDEPPFMPDANGKYVIPMPGTGNHSI